MFPMDQLVRALAHRRHALALKQDEVEHSIEQCEMLEIECKRLENNIRMDTLAHQDTALHPAVIVVWPNPHTADAHVEIDKDLSGYLEAE